MTSVNIHESALAEIRQELADLTKKETSIEERKKILMAAEQYHAGETGQVNGHLNVKQEDKNQQSDLSKSSWHDAVLTVFTRVGEKLSSAEIARRLAARGRKGKHKDLRKIVHSVIDRGCVPNGEIIKSLEERKAMWEFTENGLKAREKV
ncbi:MAG TPA: hypothetical protein VK395_37830 [Gemmataceae bacterium]|nr:hypothetical protein [Gemmataceae bacterium]